MPGGIERVVQDIAEGLKDETEMENFDLPGKRSGNCRKGSWSQGQKMCKLGDAFFSSSCAYFF